MKVLYSLLSVVLVVLAPGCGSSPVADDLGQREANKIVAVLGENGIEATTEKARGAKGRYSVTVPSSSFASAAALLTRLGLPAERGASFSELMAPSGILPSSQGVEDLRMDRAIASEIEDLLMSHAGIATASVVVRFHSVPGSAAPSISLVIQAHRGATLDQEKLIEIIGRAVPGVKTSDVSFAVSEVNHALCPQSAAGADEQLVPFLKFWKVPRSEYNQLAYLIICLMSLVAFFAGLGGYIYGQYDAAKSVDTQSRKTGLSQRSSIVPLNRDEEEDV